ncbi:MAG TPA: DNA replication/repair protein RecF [Longimicrobiales bacterium]|nr:DNA replication/repair protein RecF [Longimicrobiales bacterium]
MAAASTVLVCRELRLRQFRNYAELDLVLPRQGVALIGDNGSGKTNLLEAIYYLEIFRSFRGAPDEQLVKFGADTFYVRGRFQDPATDRTLEIAAAYDRRTRKKRVTVGGVEPERLGDAIGQIGIVVFSPSDVAVVAGSPAERRRFMDIALSLNAPGYLQALQRYRQTLRQRNTLLRDGASPSLLAVWDHGLVESGARVMAARANWAAAHADAFANYYSAISGGPAARLVYRAAAPVPPGPDVSVEDVAQAFRAELARLAPRERDRGTTLTGPHRDDFGFELVGRDGPRDLREFGSGGQQRTAAIALRLVEAATVREARGREPIILLDDVFAELDTGRARRILDLLEAEARGQVILTAPKPTDLEPRHGELERWKVADGTVTP